MVVIAKIFETYVSSRNLNLSLGKVHCSVRKLFFSLGNNHVLEEKELKLQWGAT
jgi:hypothetical protein